MIKHVHEDVLNLLHWMSIMLFLLTATSAAWGFFNHEKVRWVLVVLLLIFSGWIFKACCTEEMRRQKRDGYLL